MTTVRITLPPTGYNKQMCGFSKRFLARGLLLVPMGLAAYLRLANIGLNPGWYTDEATHLLIAQQLLNGRLQYLAINQSILLFARLPLFEWLLAGIGLLFDLNMLTLRLLTAVPTLITLLILIAPFLLTIQALHHQSQTRFTLSIDPFLVNPLDAQKTADFLAPHLLPHDITIANPAIAWMLPRQTADFQLMVSVSNQATPHLPANIPPNRYAFDPQYQNARFIIIDNLWHHWGLPNIPTLATTTQEIENNWPLIYQSGEIAIYANPAIKTRE